MCRKSSLSSQAGQHGKARGWSATQAHKRALAPDATGTNPYPSAGGERSHTCYSRNERLAIGECRDPGSKTPTLSSTNIRDTLGQLRELYSTMEGKTKNKEEEEEPAHSQEDRRLGPAHFLETTYTAHTRREQAEEERKTMNTISY